MDIFLISRYQGLVQPSNFTNIRSEHVLMSFPSHTPSKTDPPKPNQHHYHSLLVIPIPTKMGIKHGKEVIYSLFGLSIRDATDICKTPANETNLSTPVIDVDCSNTCFKGGTHTQSLSLFARVLPILLPCQLLTSALSLPSASPCHITPSTPLHISLPHH